MTAIIICPHCGDAFWADRHPVCRAIADTHPKGGDALAAPSLMSGGGAEGNRTNPIDTVSKAA